MPLIGIDTLRGKPPEYRAALFDAIYQTLSEVAGLAADDRHEAITEYEPTISFRFDRGATQLRCDPGAALFRPGLHPQPETDLASPRY
jgi:hypothetical protein